MPGPTEPTGSVYPMQRPFRRVLGIETSCDETAAAVIEDGTTIVSSVVSSQVDLHAAYGGVVPELAGRAHVELLTPVLEDALARAGSDASGTGIDGIAVTYGPGLIGSLLVGVSEAKALAMAWGVPYVGVNHLEAHLFASLLEQPDLGWPLAVLLVSGGHSLVIEVAEPGRYRILGGTIDDAAGEAFDKVARFLGLGYPGGPAIDRIATEGDPGAYRFPRSLPGDGYDLSFSGLKTSVVNMVRKHPDVPTADVAASFQAAVVDVLVERARTAARSIGARAICLAGGVAANSLLRARIEEVCAEDGIGAFLPSRSLCTDNAAMVAAAGAWHLEQGHRSGLDLGRRPQPAPGVDRAGSGGVPGLTPSPDAALWHSPGPFANPVRNRYAGTRKHRLLIRATGGRFHEPAAPRRPHRRPPRRVGGDDRLRPGDPRYRQGEAPAGRGPGRGPRAVVPRPPVTWSPSTSPSATPSSTRSTAGPRSAPTARICSSSPAVTSWPR